MTIPPFNPDARCPKCGGNRIAITWREIAEPFRVRALHEGAEGLVVVQDSDCLERTCERCGYAWPEAPLDQEAG